MTLADLSPRQINRLLTHARYLKQVSLPWLMPQTRQDRQLRMPSQSLFGKSIAMLFSKRSTRTRLSAETSAALLGGKALFLGKEDIQLGVNETVRDSARVIGGQCQGIFARVGEHEEIAVNCSKWCALRSRTDCARLNRNWQNTRLSLYSTLCPRYGIRRKFWRICLRCKNMHISSILAYGLCRNHQTRSLV